MIPATSNYNDAVRGDTVNTRRFTVTETVNDITTPLDLTGVVVKVKFSTQAANLVKTIGDGVTIVDASGGIFDIDEMTFTVLGTYKYDIQFTFASGDVKTYVKGVIKIVEDITT
jgi:hypothetical protein